MYKTVADVNWDTWSADITLHLCLYFVITILLIHKKRTRQRKNKRTGGKLESGESLLECAIRETRRRYV